ncbi:MAG: hypothetical protein CMQ61_14925 [Gammaproteobacteria bacterium]|nr:hypothetical protein [Gammaproteobacteria bacterium]
MTDYRGGGLCALVEHRLGRRQRTVSAELIEALLRLLERTPQSLGYLRSTWSSKSMAMALNSHQGLDIHPSTVRRLLPRLNIMWRRARPTLSFTRPRLCNAGWPTNQSSNCSSSSSTIFG